jgi:hypothetical protein
MVSNPMNGFQSKIWGPSAWLFLHTITLNFIPNKHSEKGYINFFKNLKYVLPCITCRSNYADIIRSGDLKLTARILTSRDTLVEWLFKVHNLINTRTGKTLTYSNDSKGLESMKQFYEQFRARCDDTKKEIGCTKSLYKGKRYRCILLIRPATTKSKTIKICKR